MDHKKDVIDIINELDKFEPKIKEILYAKMCFTVSMMTEEISNCESPIEQLLTLTLWDIADAWGLGFKYGFYLENQEEIKVLNKVYYADICLFLGDITDLNSCKKLIVECDGHDFHEKTKQQAKHDKQRDRLLLQAGYTVIHFPGSEIWSDAYKCAREALSLLLNLK